MLVDRINALTKTLCVHTISFGGLSGRGHKILDILDKHAGIDTSKTLCGYVCGRQGLWRAALLGERVRRLERHVFNTPARPYFWLGAEAENHEMSIG